MSRYKTWVDMRVDTITAALSYPDSISLVFASHRRPGGGYLNHQQGQEEWIARRTNLVNRLQPHRYLYGDNRKPFYIVLKGVEIVGQDVVRDFICSPAPLVSAYPNPYEEMDRRVREVCLAVKEYPVFITGAWGCGFFGNKLEDVTALFKKHATNETVVMAIKSNNEGRK